MSDILEELRHHEKDYPSLIHGPLCGKAADEIERLREALRLTRKDLTSAARYIDKELAYSFPPSDVGSPPHD